MGLVGFCILLFFNDEFCVFLSDDDGERHRGAAVSLPEGLDGGAFEGFGQNRVLGVNQF